MTTYKGKRVDGRAEVSKFVDGVEQPFPTRTDIRNHSPNGFEWGYGGSGPAQLALAMLADHLGPNDPPAQCPFCDMQLDDDGNCAQDDCKYEWNKDDGKWSKVNRLYQDFKAEVIAPLPRGEAWTITSNQIEDWLRMSALRRQP